MGLIFKIKYAPTRVSKGRDILLSLCPDPCPGTSWDKITFPKKGKEKTCNFAHLCHFQEENSDCPVPSCVLRPVLDFDRKIVIVLSRIRLVARF